MKETVKRAIRTFFQAFVGFLVVNLSESFAGIADGGMIAETATALIASAIAAGLAAVMNMPKRGERD